MKLSELAKFSAAAIYEACRIEAVESSRPIVPEPWLERDEQFRTQFVETIRRICAHGYSTTPELEHESWVKAYEAMGWRYGPVRNTVKKTHPDMVPYHRLGQAEREKDAIFLACCAVARDVSLAVAKAVLAEAANTIEEERGGWRDWEGDVSGTERAAGVCWSAERIRSLATELERESDAR